MNTVDIAVLAVLAIFGGLGLYWGLIRQILSVIGLIAGIVLASRYGSDVAVWLSSFVDNNTITQPLGFIFVLIAVTSIASLAASLLRNFVGLLFLGWLDHMAGGILGLVQGALAATVLLVVGATVPNEVLVLALANSRFASLLLRVFSSILLLLPDSFRAAAQIVFGIN